MRFRLLVLTSSLLPLLGCSSASLEPLFTVRQAITVTPAEPPGVIWVLDNSGSMSFPLDPSSPPCAADPTCGGNAGARDCPSSCLTRKKAALDWLAEQKYGETRHSSVIFPLGSTTKLQCEAGNQLVEFSGIDSLHQNWEDDDVGGGTPTAKTLMFVADSAPNLNTDTFVVLITDGLPNCGGGPNLNDVDVDGVTAASKKLLDVYQRLLVIGIGDALQGSQIDENPGV